MTLDWLPVNRGLIMIGCWYQFNREEQAFCIIYTVGQHFFISMCLLASVSHWLSLLSVLLKGISRYSPVPLSPSLSLSLSLSEQDPRWMIARPESTCFSRTSDGQRIIKMMSQQEEAFSWPLPSHNHGPPGPLSHLPAACRRKSWVVVHFSRG